MRWQSVVVLISWLSITFCHGVRAADNWNATAEILSLEHLLTVGPTAEFPTIILSQSGYFCRSTATHKQPYVSYFLARQWANERIHMRNESIRNLSDTLSWSSLLECYYSTTRQRCVPFRMAQLRSECDHASAVPLRMSDTPFSLLKAFDKVEQAITSFDYAMQGGHLSDIEHFSSTLNQTLLAVLDSDIRSHMQHVSRIWREAYSGLAPNSLLASSSDLLNAMLAQTAPVGRTVDIFHALTMQRLETLSNFTASDKDTVLIANHEINVNLAFARVVLLMRADSNRTGTIGRMKTELQNALSRFWDPSQRLSCLKEELSKDFTDFSVCRLATEAPDVKVRAWAMDFGRLSVAVTDEIRNNVGSCLLNNGTTRLWTFPGASATPNGLQFANYTFSFPRNWTFTDTTVSTEVNFTAMYNATGAVCRPGQYNPPACLSCPIGSFCPGNDLRHICANGAPASAIQYIHENQTTPACRFTCIDSGSIVLLNNSRSSPWQTGQCVPVPVGFVRWNDTSYVPCEKPVGNWMLVGAGREVGNRKSCPVVPTFQTLWSNVTEQQQFVAVLQSAMSDDVTLSLSLNATFDYLEHDTAAQLFAIEPLLRVYALRPRNDSVRIAVEFGPRDSPLNVIRSVALRTSLAVHAIDILLHPSQKVCQVEVNGIHVAEGFWHISLWNANLRNTNVSTMQVTNATTTIWAQNISEITIGSTSIPSMDLASRALARDLSSVQFTTLVPLIGIVRNFTVSAAPWATNSGTGAKTSTRPAIRLPYCGSLQYAVINESTVLHVSGANLSVSVQAYGGTNLLVQQSVNNSHTMGTVVQLPPGVSQLFIQTAFEIAIRVATVSLLSIPLAAQTIPASKQYTNVPLAATALAQWKCQHCPLHAIASWPPRLSVYSCSCAAGSIQHPLQCVDPQQDTINTVITSTVDDLLFLSPAGEMLLPYGELQSVSMAIAGTSNKTAAAEHCNIAVHMFSSSSEETTVANSTALFVLTTVGHNTITATTRCHGVVKSTKTWTVRVVPRVQLGRLLPHPSEFSEDGTGSRSLWIETLDPSSSTAWRFSAECSFSVRYKLYGSTDAYRNDRNATRAWSGQGDSSILFNPFAPPIVELGQVLVARAFANDYFPSDVVIMRYDLVYEVNNGELVGKHRDVAPVASSSASPEPTMAVEDFCASYMYVCVGVPALLTLVILVAATQFLLNRKRRLKQKMLAERKQSAILNVPPVSTPSPTESKPSAEASQTVDDATACNKPAQSITASSQSAESEKKDSNVGTPSLCDHEASDAVCWCTHCNARLCQQCDQAHEPEQNGHRRCLAWHCSVCNLSYTVKCMVAENRKPICQECAERTGVLQGNTLPMRQCQVCGDYEALYRSSGLVNGVVCWSCACTLVTDCAVEPVAAIDNQPEHVGIDHKELRSATLS